MDVGSWVPSDALHPTGVLPCILWRGRAEQQPTAHNLQEHDKDERRFRSAHKTKDVIISLLLLLYVKYMCSPMYNRNLQGIQ